MPLPVACYVRVSTENQLENYSIEEQTQRLRAYCAAKDWAILNIYTDGGYSGGNTDRPALKQMLSDIRAGAVGAVVVYKLDRLSRSQKDTLTLIEDEFLAHNVDFVSINENFDTTTPFGRAMIGILSVFAQLEKDQITERFTMGRIGRGKAGYFHGGGVIPTGYDYVGGKLIVNEYQAQQVREAFSLFLAGNSINAIYRALHAKYGGWGSASMVLNVLRNNLYAGYVKFRGASYPGIHAPIISQETYAATQRLLNSPAREEAKNTAQKNPFRAGFLLSGLVVCGNCGARYHGNHGYYKCYSRAKSSKKFIVDPTCKNDNWPIEELDAYVVDQITRVCASPEAVHRLFANRPPRQDAGPDPARIKAQIDDLSKQTLRLIELYQIGGVPIEELSKRIHKLDTEKSSLEALLATTQQPTEDQTHHFTTALEAFRSGFTTSGPETRRLLVAAIVQKITINGQAPTIEWRI